jgi:hypothetical protein
MKDDSGPRAFGTIRRTLQRMLPRELVLLIGELYSLSPENRRFLQSRFGDRSKQLADCRKLIADCMFPDVFRKDSRVRITDAKRAISQYQQATGDSAGTIELMLTFVEQGTELALDIGYEGASFFSALENMLSRAVNLLRMGKLKQGTKDRLLRLADSSRPIGWGFGFFVDDQISDLIENVDVCADDELDEAN